MAELTVPATAESVTAEWLTAVLRDAGAVERATVTSVDRETIAVGQGFASQLARFSLEYDVQEDGAPASLIGKFQSSHDTTRRLMGQVGAYEREVRFYAELADEVGLPTPRCYRAARDASSGVFVLLLEDLLPSVVGDQVAGATAEQAEFVIRELGRFHARWWNSDRLRDTSWMQPSADLAERGMALFEAGREPFREQLATDHPTLVDMAERVGDLLPSVLASLERTSIPSPFTLLHGDMRLDNLFIPTEEGGRFAVIDWQGVAAGPPASEVALWLVLSLSVERRRADEAELLRIYHRTLAEHGVTDYRLGKLRRDYRNALLQQLVGAVILAGTLDFGSERGVELITVATERLEAALADHNVDRLLRIAPWALRAQRLWQRVLTPFRWSASDGTQM